MQDAAAMRGVERRGDLATDARRGVGIERPPLPHPHGEIRARHVLHDDEAPRALVDDVVDGDDVGMAECAHRLHFTTQPLPGKPRRGKGRNEQFDRDIRSNAAVPRPVHDRVAAPADLFRDLVAAGQDHAGGEIGRLDHGRGPSGAARGCSARSASSRRSDGNKRGRQ